MNFFCIADKESGLGFRLAGIQTREVSSREEALDALNAARASKEIGIILVTGKAADFMREEVAEHISVGPLSPADREEPGRVRTLPLILEVPSRGEQRQRRSAGELLRQIAGV